MKAETFNDNFIENLNRFIGETVTIFVQSGGDSGLGFTGVIFRANNSFVRLITHIGPAPEHIPGRFDSIPKGRSKSSIGYYNGMYISENFGAITDIPIDKITSFVHNTV